MGGRTTRLALGFGLFSIISILIALRSSSPSSSHIVSDSSPRKSHQSSSLFHFCKFRQRIDVALPDGTGSVRGIRCTNSMVEAFLGIPFAKPPIGPLRFNSPKPLDANPSNIFQASQYGKICLQPATARPASSMSEDCLTINVFRPRGTSSRDKLPVMVWVYGGGITTGDAISYDPTSIISEGANKAHPVIYVSFNYRLHSLGFTASSIMEQAAALGDASLNAGLYDMQSALLWVQRNIGAFGGDKSKVTVFGQSAGAFLTGAFLVADGGQAVSKLNLFRATILQSGGPIGVPGRFPNQTDPVFESLLAAAGCSPSSAAPLECLRAKSEDEILRATVTSWSKNPLSIPYAPARDGYFGDSANSENVRRGRIATVPIIIGNCLDEGTILAPTKLVDTPGIEEFYKGYVRGQDIESFLPSLRTALTLYPDDPKRGSPYEPSKASPSDRFYGRRNQYKRMASLMGDWVFESGRRALLQQYIKRDADYPVYAFLFATHVPGEPPALGVSHGSDLEFLYVKYEALDPTSQLGKIAISVLNAWINFAYYMNPNGDGVPPWPKYGGDRRMLRIDSKFKIITDNYREEGITFLASRNWTTLLDF